MSHSPPHVIPTLPCSLHGFPGLDTALLSGPRRTGNYLADLSRDPFRRPLTPFRSISPNETARLIPCSPGILRSPGLPFRLTFPSLSSPPTSPSRPLQFPLPWLAPHRPPRPAWPPLPCPSLSQRNCLAKSAQEPFCRPWTPQPLRLPLSTSGQRAHACPLASHGLPVPITSAQGLCPVFAPRPSPAAGTPPQTIPAIPTASGCPAQTARKSSVPRPPRPATCLPS